MSKFQSIPDDTIEKFKCSQCNNYLSNFPVFLIEEEKNVCGRCSIPKETTRFRCKIFEEFARHIKFPCRYKEQGCCEELYPEDVPSHETSCYFKIVECPGKDFVSCSWKGIRSIMLSHCRDKHDDTILKDNLFELDINVDRLSLNFLENNGTLYIIALKHELENKILKHCVYHVEETIHPENNSYQIVLSRDKFKFSIESQTTLFSKRSEWHEIALESLIKHSVQTLPITGSIVFEKNIKDAVSSRLNEEMLSLLKCSACEMYVLSPIYHYEDDTIKCDKCCSGIGSRNFSLDRIAEKLNYPCRYVKNGCRVVLKCEKMKDHVSICPFKEESCSFCGEWSGLCKNLKIHVEDAHVNMIVKNREDILVKPDHLELKCSVAGLAPQPSPQPAPTNNPSLSQRTKSCDSTSSLRPTKIDKNHISVMDTPVFKARFTPVPAPQLSPVFAPVSPSLSQRTNSYDSTSSLRPTRTDKSDFGLMDTPVSKARFTSVPAPQLSPVFAPAY